MHSIPHGLPSIWSLPAWGVWIEIEKMIKTFDVLSSRSPHGECGLKSAEVEILGYVPTSLPAWGVWIEIYGNTVASGNYTSLPAWGVWIEIYNLKIDGALVGVAPRMGSVD